MQTASAFELSNLKVVRSGAAILDVESLAVPAGGILAVLGSNGAGKTTLLNVLALLTQPDEGWFSFFGKPLSPGQGPSLADRRRVTLVMQSPWLFDGTVLFNAAYPQRARGARRADAEEKAMAALRLLALEKLASRRARTLSGGEARRLAVARAVAAEPDALLLDEPTADVDEKNRELIESAVAAINGERGVTVVFSSHERDQAPRLGAAFVRLAAGRPVANEDRPVGRDDGDQHA